METKNLTIETLSPVFIGNGESYSKLDYEAIPKNGAYTVKIYDINKIIDDLGNYLSPEELCYIFDNLEHEKHSIVEYLRENKNVEIQFNKYLIRKYFTRINLSWKYKKDIKQFIHQNFMPYIPGSSIKGAINTALLYKKLSDLDKPDIEKLLSKKIFPNKKDEKYSFYFNVSNGEERYYIFDSFFNTKYLDIFLTLRFYVYYKPKNKKQWDKFGNVDYGKNNLVEGLKPNQKFNLKIKCSNEKFNEIKKACNELSLEICKWEIEILKKYKEKGKFKNIYNELMEFYNTLKANIEENYENAIFTNIGWGGGYLPKTMYILVYKKKINFDKLKDNLNTKHKKDLSDYDEFPFTRTITRFYNGTCLKNYPLGWIKIEG